MIVISHKLLAVFDAAKVPERFRVFGKGAGCCIVIDFAMTAAKKEPITVETIDPLAIADLVSEISFRSRRLGPIAGPSRAILPPLSLLRPPWPATASA